MSHLLLREGRSSVTLCLRNSSSAGGGRVLSRASTVDEEREVGEAGSPLGGSADHRLRCRAGRHGLTAPDRPHRLPGRHLRSFGRAAPIIGCAAGPGGTASPLPTDLTVSRVATSSHFRSFRLTTS